MSSELHRGITFLQCSTRELGHKALQFMSDIDRQPKWTAGQQKQLTLTMHTWLRYGDLTPLKLMHHQRHRPKFDVTRTMTKYNIKPTNMY
eukprot:2237851-Amphidinium_carterae.1